MPILTPTGFLSFAEYRQFAWAREFYDQERQQKYTYLKTRLERIGDALVYPTMTITDYIMQHIRHPLMILVATTTALIALTILFYPKALLGTLKRVFPVAQKLQPWMMKGGLFMALQSTILGIGLRTLGRLDPSGEVWHLWDRHPRSLVPIATGTQVVRRDI